MKAKYTTYRAFTLVEALVTLCIVLIIFGLFYPIFAGPKEITGKVLKTEIIYTRAGSTYGYRYMIFTNKGALEVSADVYGFTEIGKIYKFKKSYGTFRDLELIEAEAN
jgi:hypothetical protein